VEKNVKMTAAAVDEKDAKENLLNLMQLDVCSSGL
jgi:hypothetical protein